MMRTQLINTHFRMKENLWTKKSFITNINNKRLLGDRVCSFECLDPLRLIIVIFTKFFDYVRTDVAEPFLKQTLKD